MLHAPTHSARTNKAVTIVVRKAIIANPYTNRYSQKFRIIKKNVGHLFEKHITKIISLRFTSSKSIL